MSRCSKGTFAQRRPKQLGQSASTIQFSSRPSWYLTTSDNQLIFEQSWVARYVSLTWLRLVHTSQEIHNLQMFRWLYSHLHQWNTWQCSLEWFHLSSSEWLGMCVSLTWLGLVHTSQKIPNYYYYCIANEVSQRLLKHLQIANLWNLKHVEPFNQ